MTDNTNKLTGQAALSDFTLKGGGHLRPLNQLFGHSNPCMEKERGLASKVAALPRVIVGKLNTSIVPAERLSQDLGVELFFKLEQETGLGPAGGNKVRKIQFALGEALKLGADTVITAGGIQSNHCVQTADACNKLGLECHVVVSGTIPAALSGNAFYTRDKYGATLHGAPKDSPSASREARMEALRAELQASGKKPYIIPVGASNGVGTVGFVLAMFELRKQLKEANLEIDTIVVSTSSGGTQAGMILGKKLSAFPGRIIGSSVDNDPQSGFEELLVRLANDAAEYIGVPERVELGDVKVHYGALGPYAELRAEEVEAIDFCTSRGGPELDPVYTVRGFRGMQQLISSGEIRAGEKVLFWHSGGCGAWEAYRDPYAKLLSSSR